MASTGMHDKLFADGGLSGRLREDIIPWDDAPSATMSIVSKHHTMASTRRAGSDLDTFGCGYVPGTHGLLVFKNGILLCEGVDYEETEIETSGHSEHVLLLKDAEGGATYEFVAHGGVEYEVFYGIKYTVLPETDGVSATCCPISASQIGSGSLSIDWGDGSSEILSAGSDSAPPVHAYAVGGTAYQVKIVENEEDTWETVSGLLFGSSDGGEARVPYLVSVDDQLPRIGTTSFENLFAGNDRLRRVNKHLFESNIGAASFRAAFKGATSLEEIPHPLFWNCEQATDFSECFRGCSSVESVPYELFWDCPAAENFEGCFRGVGMHVLPASLFEYCWNAKAFDRCFAECTNLTTLPDELFADCPNIESLDGCFADGSPDMDFDLDLKHALNVTSADLFADGTGSESGNVVVVEGNSVTEATFRAANGPNVTVHTYWSEGEDGVIKYTVAPESTESLTYCPLDAYRLKSGSVNIDWGDGTSEILTSGSSTTPPKHAYPTDDGTRYQITITENSEDAFGYIAALWFGTNTSSHTMSVSALSYTPTYDDEDDESFSHEHRVSTLASTPTDNSASRVRYLVSVDAPIPPIGHNTSSYLKMRAYMFYQNALLETVHPKLFKYSGDATSMRYCFYECESLKEIPDGLLDHCAKCGSFARGFYGCKTLKEIPKRLFDNFTLCETFAFCFYECENLSVVPEGLFDNCQKVDTFGRLFYGCTSLESVPDELFAKSTAATTFTETFNAASSELKFNLDFTDLAKVSTITSFAYTEHNTVNLANRIVRVKSGTTTASKFGTGTQTSLGVTVEVVS